MRRNRPARAPISTRCGPRTPRSSSTSRAARRGPRDIVESLPAEGRALVIGSQPDQRGSGPWPHRSCRRAARQGRRACWSPRTTVGTTSPTCPRSRYASTSAMPSARALVISSPRLPNNRTKGAAIMGVDETPWRSRCAAGPRALGPRPPPSRVYPLLARFRKMPCGPVGVFAADAEDVARRVLEIAVLGEAPGHRMIGGRVSPEGGDASEGAGRDGGGRDRRQQHAGGALGQIHEASRYQAAVRAIPSSRSTRGA